MPFVYIVRCADDTLYCGYALDVARRLQAHNAGTGARYTSGRRPVQLVYAERHRTRGAALRREYQVKQLTRLAKERLIAATRAEGRTVTRARRAKGPEKPAAGRKRPAARHEDIVRAR